VTRGVLVYYVVHTYILRLGEPPGAAVSSRRFVAIPESVLIETIKVAERLGIPYTVLIERILVEVLRVLRYRRDVLDSLSMVDAFTDIRRLGGIVLPENVVREVLGKVDRGTFERLCSELTRMGSWFGELSRAKRAVTVSEVKNSLGLWFPSSSIDVSRDTNTGEVKFVISLVNPSRELLELGRCVVEGLARGYDLGDYSITVGNSLIVLRVGKLAEE
jgi:hypothetical protein